MLANSDYFPVVDLDAVQARYLVLDANILEQGRRIEIALQPAQWNQALMRATIKGVPTTSAYALETIGMRKHLKGVAGDGKQHIKDSDRKTYSALLRLEALLGRCGVEREQNAFFKDALLFARQTNAYAPPGAFTAFWDSQVSSACFDQKAVNAPGGA